MTPPILKRTEPTPYRIGTVSRLTGISTHALRVWERRYGDQAAARTAGGSRRYSESDVARLKLVKRLLDEGHSIGRIAHLSKPELEELVGDRGQLVSQPSKGWAATICDRILSTMATMDVAAADAVLSTATATMPPAQIVADVVAPLMREVGDRWESGRLSVAEEHAISAMVRNHLGMLMRVHARPDSNRIAIGATFPGDRHEFGALCATLLAASAGWRTIYLGPSLPPSEIARTVVQTGAELVLISVIGIRRRQALRWMRKLRTDLPSGTKIVLGGRAFGDLGPLEGLHGPLELGDAEAYLKLLLASEP